MLQFGRMLSKLMQFKCIMDGGLGAKPTVAGQFSQFLEKNYHFKGHLDHIWSVFKAIEKNKVAEIKNLLEIPKLPSHCSPLYLQIKLNDVRLKFRIYEYACSQKFAMREELFGGLGEESPALQNFAFFFAKIA